MKEILKQLPNGDWTHDCWVDEEGNKIIETVVTIPEVTNEALATKLGQLEDLIVYTITGGQ